MDKYKIDDLRLEVAASFGRLGARVADIGTDHASLPIYLVGNSIAPCALACDINEGPLRAAKLNIASAGLSDRISTRLTDGLSGIEDYAPEDIYILGMGGELISKIVLASELSKKSGVRLILQPMTHAHDLRSDLYANGYHIIDETLIKDRDRVYQIIAAEYDGTVTSATEVELWLGKKNIERGGEDLKELALLYASGLEKKIKGYAEAGKTDEATNELYAELKKLAESVN